MSRTSDVRKQYAAREPSLGRPCYIVLFTETAS
jgi:hypothetical protein